MENNDELKEIDIKNCIFYYFDGIIKIYDFGFDNILIDEKSYENILVCKISCKTFISTKSLHISIVVIPTRMMIPRHKTGFCFS